MESRAFFWVLMDLDHYEAAYPPRVLPDGAEVTRIGPSPTGKPHIGTALQAVINRAIADGSDGRFLVRIEDTDQERSVAGAYEDLLANLAWLGVEPDEGAEKGGAYGPYVQSQRLEIYQTAARALVAGGHAYWCFCTPERLKKVREEQEALKKPTMYDRHCRHLEPGTVESRLAAAESAVIRLKVPDGERIGFEDLVRGPIEFDSETIDDSVILKSDGFPTYHLAVVVDDHFMRVTITVRGEEWIPSTPKHVLLYRAFGWQMPRFAHTPILRDMSRRKLSKRSGDTSISWYRIQGFLPEGLRNFLTRIIWVHPEGKDVYDHGEFVRGFRPADLPNSGPVVDLQLLDFINGQYLRQIPAAELCGVVENYLQFLIGLDQDLAFDDVTPAGPARHELSREALLAFDEAFRRDRAFSEGVLGLEPERFKRLSDVLLNTPYYFPDLFVPASKLLLAKPLGEPGKAATALDKYLYLYDEADLHPVWEQKVRGLAQEFGFKDGKVFMTLRIAMTGSEQTPPLFEILEILGGDEVRRRLALAAQVLAAQA